MRGKLRFGVLIPLLGVFMVALWLVTSLKAQAITPAGTVIGNAATATYYDENNNQYTTTSNLVQTTVAEVCGVDVEGGGDKEGVPGQIVYVPFTVTNTGNGENTFTLSTNGTYTKTIYLDENQNGVADPGESAVTSVTLGMGETANLVVAVEVPANASAGDQDNFALTATGTDPGDCSDSADATVTVISDALIQANKQVDKDTAAPGDVLTFTINFQNVGTKPAKSLDGFNVDLNGDGAVETGVEGILVYDQIPTGTTYVSDSAEGAPSPGFVVYSQNGTDWYKNEDDAGTVNYVGFFIPDADPQNDEQEDVLDPDQQGSLTFKVTVNDPFDDPDGEVNNTATITYATSTGEEKEVTTNETTTTIPPAELADVAVSQRVDSASEVEDDEAGGDYTDDNTATNVPAGSWVEFTHSAANRSAAIDDVIELDYDAADSKIPTGAIVEFWNADGTAKLIDTDGDGKVDLGTLAPGEKKDFVVKVYIPADTPEAAQDNVVDYYVTVIASSGTNPDEVDRSRDNIDGVIKAGVDIGKVGTLLDDKNDPSDGNTDGTNDSDDFLPDDNGNNGIVNIIDPGQTAVYPMEIANTGASPDQYSLSASGNPNNSTVKFYTDPNCDGNYADGEQITDTPLIAGTVLKSAASSGTNTLELYSVAEITAGDTLIVGYGKSSAEEVVVESVDVNTNTVTLKEELANDHLAGEQVAEKICVVMTVETDETTPAGEYYLVVEAKSENSGAADSLDAYLKVNPVCSVVISPEHSDQLPPGGTTTYQHIVTNSGNVSANVTVSVPESGTQLTYVILDANQNPQGTSYELTLNAGESATFYVKVTAPSDVPPGTVESVEVTAEADIDDDDNTDCTSAITDTTTIIEGYLELTKTVDKTEAAPGEELTYTIKYKNIGDKDALNVVITDPIPDHTTFVSGSLCLDKDCNGVCDPTDVSYTDDAGDDQAEYDEVNNLVRFRVGEGADETNGGTVAPGVEGCVLFKVRIE